MTPERPKWNDEMAKELAVIMSKIVAEHAQCDPSECMEDCQKILKWNSNEDGYHLAKELDSLGYTADSNLVEELDSIMFERDDVIKSHIQQWVVNNNLKLSTPIGAQVTFKERRLLVKSGVVVKHYPETMQVGVRTPEQPETGHYLINEEDLVKP